MNDLRYAIRQLLKSPGFTVTPLATAALCLGANFAIFAVIDSVLLRPLPFPQSDRYAVAQQRREIGIRMALGAEKGQIGRQFLSVGLRLTAVGILLGCFGAWIAGRTVQSLLLGVPAFPLLIIAGTALTMSAVALVACLYPAHRATRVEPMEALRYE